MTARLNLALGAPTTRVTNSLATLRPHCSTTIRQSNVSFEVVQDCSIVKAIHLVQHKRCTPGCRSESYLLNQITGTISLRLEDTTAPHLYYPLYYPLYYLAFPVLNQMPIWRLPCCRSLRESLFRVYNFRRLLYSINCTVVQGPKRYMRIVASDYLYVKSLVNCRKGGRHLCCGVAANNKLQYRPDATSN